MCHGARSAALSGNPPQDSERSSDRYCPVPAPREKRDVVIRRGSSCTIENRLHPSPGPRTCSVAPAKATNHGDRHGTVRGPPQSRASSSRVAASRCASLPSRDRSSRMSFSWSTIGRRTPAGSIFVRGTRPIRSVRSPTGRPAHSRYRVARATRRPRFNSRLGAGERSPVFVLRRFICPRGTRSCGRSSGVMRRASPCAERTGKGAQRSSTNGVRRRSPGVTQAVRRQFTPTCPFAASRSFIESYPTPPLNTVTTL